MKPKLTFIAFYALAFLAGLLSAGVGKYQNAYENGYDEGWNKGNWNVIDATNLSTEKALEYNYDRHLDSLNIIVFKGEIMFDYYWSSKY